jgi:hypothetical protein
VFAGRLQCIGRPNDWSKWLHAAEGGAIDWEEIFVDYAATTDAPSCHFYKALAATYPDAKLILTVRDADRWFESTQETILSPGVVQRFSAAPADFNAMMHKLDWHPADATTHDRQRMIARITAHNAAVKSAFSPTRLLVLDLRQGWDPLCKFLGLSVPDAPFPHINSTEDFRRMMASMAGLDPSGVSEALEQQLAQQ